MAFRLYVGGIPNWYTHDQLGRWIYERTEVYPEQVQVVRARNATLCSAFVGFQRQAAAEMVLANLLAAPSTMYGVRISAAWSRDSKGGGKGPSAPAASTPAPQNPSSNAMPAPPQAAATLKESSVQAAQDFAQQFAAPSQDFGQQFAAPSQDVGQQFAAPSQDFGLQVSVAKQDFGQQFPDPTEEAVEPVASPQTVLRSPTEAAHSETTSHRDPTEDKDESSEEMPTCIVPDGADASGAGLGGIKQELEKAKEEVAHLKEELMEVKKEEAHD